MSKKKKAQKQARKDLLEIMDAARETYVSRIAVYGDTAKFRHGTTMKALLPKGITLVTPNDYARFSILNLIVAKLVRYTNRFEQPHQDSIHDIGVYAFLLEELDQDIKT